MAKCIKCGGSFLTRGRIRLADADICFKCFESLGFDRKTGIYDGKSYKWDDIKNGYDVYQRNKLRRHAQWLAENEDIADLMDALSEDDESDTEDEEAEEE